VHEPPSQGSAAARPSGAQSAPRSADAGAQSAARSQSPSPATASRTVLDDTGIRRALVRIAHEIVERNEDLERLYLVAIPNGGVPLARQLADNLKTIAGLALPVGILDTTLYRDDLSLRGERPPLRVTEMPSAVDDRVVVLVDDVDAVPLESRGRELRFHPALGAAGANANFISAPRSPGAPWRIRTYERGVEGETLACGTGTVAAALVVAELTGQPLPIDFVSRAGLELGVRAAIRGGTAEDVWLAGQGRLVFTGTFPD